jgi:hypothetical protein
MWDKSQQKVLGFRTRIGPLAGIPNRNISSTYWNFQQLTLYFNQSIRTGTLPKPLSISNNGRQHRTNTMPIIIDRSEAIFLSKARRRVPSIIPQKNIRTITKLETKKRSSNGMKLQYFLSLPGACLRIHPHSPKIATTLRIII